MFRYEAIDASGRTVRGVMDVKSVDELTRKLQSRSLRLVNVFDTFGNRINPSQQSPRPQPTAPRPSSGQKTVGLSAVTVPPGVPVSIDTKVKPRPMSFFLRQLSTMVKSGIPLSQSLRDNLRYITHPKLSDAAIKISESIDSGNRLSESMAAMTDIFPAHLIGSVLCGETGGDLDLYLEEAAEDYERDARDYVVGKIGWVLTKLTVMTFIFSLPMVLLIGNALIEQLSLSSAAQLTSSSIMADYLHRFLYTILPIGVGGIVLYIILIYIWAALKKLPAVRHTLDCYRVRFYPWGRLHRNRSIARFLRSLERLTNAGIEIGNAWNGSMLICRDSSVSLELLKGVTPPGDHTGLTERFDRAGILKVEEIGVLDGGEKAGRVGESLSSLAALYESAESGLMLAGRTFSIGAFIVFTTILYGAAAIFMTKSISTFLTYFMDMI